MSSAEYLIVGGGMTADAAVEGIRQLDPRGSIVVLAAEPDPPYTRPMLTKGLWFGKPFERVWRGTEDKGAEVRRGRRAVRLDPGARQVGDDAGETYTYRSLLLATGGRVRRLPFGGDEVIYFRTLADYRRLRELADHGDRFVVIGGGFIGSEIAAALVTNGKHVTMVFPEEAIGQRVFPRDLAEHISLVYREKGVAVEARARVTEIAGESGRAVVRLRTADGVSETILADGVVAGIGIEPDTELAASAGLEIQDGIVVDEMLRAGRPDILAAGDVASFHSPALGRRLRVEHEDNALSMGLQAGRNMAGAAEAYRHLPMFYSDLFDRGYEAVGDLDSRLTTVADWSDPYRKGVVYYLEADRVRGVLLWNLWDQVPAARALIESGERTSASELRGRIPAG
jgi:NADPH-dependent 2,4-dienoyl-CoA reductase/sulfur reductase-like enzyme